MKVSVDISLYPLADDYMPVVKTFIERIQGHAGITVIRTDLTTQLYGDYDLIMDLLKTEMELSWVTFGPGAFTIKYLPQDLRGLKDE